MKNLCDAIHADYFCNVLLFMKAFHSDDVFFVTVLLAITASAPTAGFKAAEVVEKYIKLYVAQVAVDKGLAVLKLGLEDVFGRRIARGLSQGSGRLFRVQVLEQKLALEKVLVYQH